MLKSFHPGALWLDNNGVHINAHGGGILVREGVYYWFGEHKVEGEAGNRAQIGVRCYSSRDLYNWCDEGIALAVDDDPKSDITRGCILERPKVIYNHQTHQYVMWFHLELKHTGYESARSGVAVSNTVTGPYTFLKSFRPNAGSFPINVTSEQTTPLDRQAVKQWRKFDGTYQSDITKFNILRRDYMDGQMARDMTLFVDANGSAYHLYASEENSTLHIARLQDDYLASSGDFVRVFPGRYMEAPAICKRRGKFHLIASDCTGWTPNAARSAVADSIWGPWTEMGNPCVGENSAITFGGQSSFILPITGKKDAFIAMFDLWRPQNPIDSRYIWLPIQFVQDRLMLAWMDEWDLSWFEKQSVD
jgi:hypothetical protein